jgi:RIO-like serine/threonine protein kinase
MIFWNYFGSETMDDMDRRILEAIYERSPPRKWVYSINVKKAIGLDETEFVDRLTRLERLGFINTQSGTYEKGQSLKNGMDQIRLTDLGWSVLKGKR